MKKYILLLLALLLVLPLAAKDKGELQVRIVPDRATAYAGDSMLVSVVLYASAPIAKAECTTDFTVKGKCRLRKLNINRDATASRVREGGKIYYTLVWAQYVVAPAATGNYSIPAQKFKATLQEVVRMPDLFDQMMGVRPEYREYQVTGSSEVFSFKVTEKPLRSTQEMINNGGTVF